MKKRTVCFLFFLFLNFIMGDVSYGEFIFRKNIDDVIVTAENKEDDMITNFTVTIGKQKFRRKRWESDSNPAFYPKVEKKDIDGDGKKEVFIALVTGRGTSIYIEEPHIFKQGKERLYDEVDIENPIHILKKEVITNRKGRDINIRIGEKEWGVVVPKEIPQKHLFENIAYGSQIRYKTGINELISEIGVHITPDYYIGNFVVKYEYKNDLFYVKEIIFEKET